MNRTGLAQDTRFQQHRTGPGHPERPERLEAISEALAQQGLSESCVAITPRPVDLQTLELVHHRDYIERVQHACRSGASYIDVQDSAICPESFEIAQLACGTVLEAVDAVMRGDLDNAFCAIRPPGHHAEHHLSMGFCLFNNVALAASHLINRHGLSRVLIVDFDVHHGNGTQHTFEEDPRVLFISLHGHPGIVYPGTGHADERGRGEGEGYTINLPMLPPSSDAEWQRAFEQTVLPEAQKYRPEFLLISAGFDAHKHDPLAPLELETPVFGWMTDRLVQVARSCCQGRLVSMLEGGYDRTALAEGVCLHVARLLEA